MQDQDLQKISRQDQDQDHDRLLQDQDRLLQDQDQYQDHDWLREL